MTDYLSAQNERNASALAQSYAAWEQRLRGWQIWDYAVSLEPAFGPIKPTVTQTIITINDDARVPGSFGLLFGRNQTVDPPRQLSTNQRSEVSVKATAFYRTEEVTELNILLPENLEISPALIEQFFLSLSSFSTPVSFELLADSEVVTIQIACDNSLAPHLKNQIETFFPNCLIKEKQDTLKSLLANQANTAIADFGLARNFLLPLQNFRNFNPDPLMGLISSLGNLQLGEKAIFQVLCQKAKGNWSGEVQKIFTNPDFKSVLNNQSSLSREKFSSPLFAAVIRLAVESPSKPQSWEILRRIGGNLSQFSTPNGNELIALSNYGLSDNNHFLSVLSRTSYRNGMLLNSLELASIVHFPGGSVKIEKLERNQQISKTVPNLALNNQIILGENFHQNETREVSLSNEQRTKHIHLIGSSGSGKSSLLLNLIRQDLENGEGLCVIDPHGDLIDSVIANIPENRVSDIALFDPADAEFPIGFNILKANSELEKTLLSSDLVATFRRMSTSWGDVMDSVLANAILAFVESERGGTLFELKRFLVEKEFRNKFLKTVNDEAVRYFWLNEFPLIGGKSQSSILIRLDSFLRQKLIRNIVCQKENKIDFRKLMDTRKVLLIKLSQGLIGEENAYLLGTLLVSKLYQTALSRQDSANRPFFSCYLDEFHHFITPSMENILSGVRKYNLALVLAHQEFRQLQSRSLDVASSVLSNCYTRICFRLGDTDAEKFATGFSFFDAKALQNLGTGEAIARVERADYDFNLKTNLLPAVAREIAEQRRIEVMRHSREKYGTLKSEVETLLFAPQTKEAPVESRSAANDNEVVGKTKQAIAGEAFENGNSSHQYLQNLVKRIAEKKGFRASLEKQVFGGAGKIDVALENDYQKIACEIAVTNTVNYELQNIQKCLASGYCPVIVISTDEKHLKGIRQKAEENLPPTDLANVAYLKPEAFADFLESIIGNEGSANNKTKGFKVSARYNEQFETGQIARIKSIRETLLNALKRRTQGKDE